MTRKLCIALIILAPLFACALAGGQYYDDDYDVPYVPTSQKIVDQMLIMTAVSGDDIIYDLGCGDGRIVVTAAQKYGARGVGIDINPVRIKESGENARKAGVTDKVSFLQQNLFETDFSAATVVSLYLLPSVNLKLRPEIFRQLKPGTRVVSHDFDMGSWEPDSTVVLEYDLDEVDSFSSMTLYFWKIPANVSGSWTWTAPGSTGENCTLGLQQEFQMLSGTLSAGSRVFPLQNVEISGNSFTLTVDTVSSGDHRTETYHGTVGDDEMIGKAIVDKDGRKTEYTWKALRDPSSKTRIDRDDR